MGKLASEELRKLLECIRADERVIVPPMVGYDSGVHQIGNKYLVVSTDPCIGVPQEWFGWLLINYAASDVALFGARPEFCTVNLLAPQSTKPIAFREMMIQACRAANELEIAIVTGHTGTYEGISKPIGVCTAYGQIEKDKIITPGGARPRDLVFCIKPVGPEVVVNFVLTRKEAAKRIFGIHKAKELEELVPMQSSVREALLLAKCGGVRAMHDATEGGLTACLNEIAETSKVGFRIDYEKIPICKEAKTLAKHFHLSDEQLLALSSTGTILASVSPRAREKVEAIMRRNKIQATVLGTFTKNEQRTLLKDGRQTSFPEDASDPYARILSGKL